MSDEEQHALRIHQVIGVPYYRALSDGPIGQCVSHRCILRLARVTSLLTLSGCIDVQYADATTETLNHNTLSLAVVLQPAQVVSVSALKIEWEF